MYKNYTKELGIPRRYIAKLLLIMRLTTIILIATLLQVSASTLAQKVSLSASNASLKSVLKDIRTQSGYDFVISESIIKAAKPITVSLKDVELKDALDKIFSGQDLTYSIDKTTIMVKEKDGPSFLDKVAALFNTVDVRGRVVDERYQPVLGATVRVKDGKGVTVTDEKGQFLIKKVDEKAELIITYIGYKEKHIKLDDDIFNIKLELSSSQLDEVQVQFAGTTSRRISTGDITSLKAADIEKQPINNPLLALQGKVPGLIVTPTSGVPGAAVNVQLRGQNSLAGLTSEPLYVVNGVPVSNNINGLGGAVGFGVNGLSSLSFINPADIESIDVLKDADATSIYGSRGANGVILITTKKGKAGPTRVDINILTSYSTDPKFLKLMNTQQYLQLRKEAFKNDGIDFNVAPYNDPAYKYQTAPDLFLWDKNKYTDWQKVILGGTAKNQMFQGNVSGGSELVQYTIGGNYNNQAYILPGNGRDQNLKGYLSLTGRSPDQKLTVNLTSNISYNNNVSPPAGLVSAINLAPNAPAPYTSTGQLNWEPNPASPIGQATWQNPFAELLTIQKGSLTQIGETALISYQLLPSLIIKANFGFNQLKGNSFTPNPLAAIATWLQPYSQRISYFASTSTSSLNAEPQLVYTKDISSGILTVLVGGNYQRQDTGSEVLNAFGFSSDALLQNLRAATGYSGSNFSSQYKYLGAYTRIGYNWLDKYIINVNVRRDGSSRFGPLNQYGNFGSVGAAWAFSNERWIQSALPSLSFGKVRASYGVIGNDQIGDYKYLETYQPIENVLYQGVKTITSNGVVNPYFQWERVRKLELGMDLAFLKDRIFLTAVYFRNRSSNQLMSTPLPSTAGQINGNFIENQNAEIQNSGWEFTLSTANIKTSNFSWRSAFNLSIPRNKLLYYDPEEYHLPYPVPTGVTGVGKPFSGATYGYGYTGVDPATGQYQFLDINGNATVLNSPNGGPYPFSTYFSYAPQFYGGLQNSFTYKRLTLDIFLQFSKQLGRNYAIDPALFSLPGVFNFNQSVEVENRWRAPGDIAEYQRANQDFSVAQDQALLIASQKGYLDASFIRLKNASLYYDLIEPGRSKSIKSLKIYVQGANLITWTNYKGVDPEVQNSSVVPPLRTISIGLTLGL